MNHSEPTVVVVAGGDAPSASSVADLPGDAVVIAVDSGLDHAIELGWDVDYAVGDFDSVDPELLASARRSDVTIVEEHPEAKDATDLELALCRAIELGATRAVVVGVGGGRLDHMLANIAVLGAAALAPLRIEARIDGARVHIVRSQPDRTALPTELTLQGAPGDLVTLLPLYGVACGVTTSGLLYPLADATLHPGTTRGVSNEFVADRAAVRVADGVLAVVVPGVRGNHLDRRPDEGASP